MRSEEYHIIPYSEEYHDKLMQLEKGMHQGNNIQLEILKEHFLNRAKLFSKNYSCIAITDDNNVIGSAIGAQTALLINGEKIDCGIGFDAKVHPSWRNKGIGRMLAKDLYKHFFQPLGLSKNIMTAKLSNAPVLNLVSRAVSNIWLYDFVYLTIPVTSRINKTNSVGKTSQQFGVQFFKNEKNPEDHYTEFANGLGYFDTYKLYKLKIKKISRVYKAGISLLKMIQPKKYTGLPAENDIFSFATLYGHTSENINGINEVLEDLEEKGIKYLMVCCRQNDAINNSLKKIAINQYGYYLVSDFPLTKKDTIAIDARCL